MILLTKPDPSSHGTRIYVDEDMAISYDKNGYTLQIELQNGFSSDTHKLVSVSTNGGDFTSHATFTDNVINISTIVIGTQNEVLLRDLCLVFEKI